MATKRQYLDLTGLTTYDEQIKSYIDSADTATSSKLTNGTITVKEAQHAASADNATHATSADSATTAGSATKATQDGNGQVISSTYETKSDASAKLTEAKGYTDTVAAGKSDVGHNHDDDYDEKGAAAAAEKAAKEYADAGIANLLDNSTEAVDSVMELAEAMENNADAIEALESIAASKASAADLSAHTGNGDIHVTAAKKSNWDAAYTHSTTAHAPANAQENVIETIKVNGTAQAISSKAVDIIVPTDNKDLANGAGYLVASDIAGKADKTALDSVSAVANEAKATSTANTTAIGSNTSAISALTGRVATLESQDTCEPIPTASITALFA